MNIIFDLDGTLIDSSAGILKALEMAFESCQQELQKPLTPALIGPPLDKLLPILAGTDDVAILGSLSKAFKESYDSEGYKETTVFEGAELMLNKLRELNGPIYLATNKRIIPTRKIIEYFKWEQFFDGIYALDSIEGLGSKKDLISYVINTHNIDRTETIYIGDTEADMTASLSNDIEFIMAMWGYGDLSFDIELSLSAGSPALVVDYLNRVNK